MANQIYERLSTPFIITLLVGLALRLRTKSGQELGNKEGFAVVTLGWAVIALFGAFPYFFHRVFMEAGRNWLVEFSFCYFESMSGFTTTGATVLNEIEHLPHAILLWRSLMHWLGGMGIVVLALAILPMCWESVGCSFIVPKSQALAKID